MNRNKRKYGKDRSEGVSTQAVVEGVGRSPLSWRCKLFWYGIPSTISDAARKRSDKVQNQAPVLRKIIWKHEQQRKKEVEIEDIYIYIYLYILL